MRTLKAKVVKAASFQYEDLLDNAFGTFVQKYVEKSLKSLARAKISYGTARSREMTFHVIQPEMGRLPFTLKHEKDSLILEGFGKQWDVKKVTADDVALAILEVLKKHGRQD